jgi:hypothetical protein
MTPSKDIPTPSSHQLYCPSSNDLIVAYGQSNLMNQGWRTRGGGGVATKASFNLLGGYVEYDVDVSKTLAGVNANIYTLSPTISNPSGFTQSDYCDGARTDDRWCVEIDWLESNGNCGGATTYHTLKGPGVGCTAWGCRTHYMYNGKTRFSMRVEVSSDGSMKVYRDGKSIDPIEPPPTLNDLRILRDAYASKGGVIYSSQWVGWVPMEDKCGRNGNLDGSEYAISNLKVFGTVLQGPKPRTCV